MKKIKMLTVFICLVFIVGCTTGKQNVSWVNDGSVTLCPGKPNCVSSMQKDSKFFIEPFRYQVEKAAALAALKEILITQKKTVFVKETADYLHVTFKTKCLGFTDDVEFYFPADKKLIHIRSASRVGYSDLGVNRRRMERLRSLFDKKLN